MKFHCPDCQEEIYTSDNVEAGDALTCGECDIEFVVDDPKDPYGLEYRFGDDDDDRCANCSDMSYEQHPNYQHTPAPSITIEESSNQYGVPKHNAGIGLSRRQQQLFGVPMESTGPHVVYGGYDAPVTQALHGTASNATGVENTAATPQGGLHMNTAAKAIEKVYGNSFAVTSIGIAQNAGNGDYKALVDGRIKVSRTVLPIDNMFYNMQVPSDAVVAGDFMTLADGTIVSVKEASADELKVVNLLTGAVTNIIPEESPDGVKFVGVIRSSVEPAIIANLIAGTLTTTQMLLVSGEKSLEQIMAMKLVAEGREPSAADLAMFQQARRDV